MFQQLTNLAYQRTPLQAFGFYIAYFFLLMLVAMLFSGVFGLITGKNDFQTGAVIGNIIAIVTSLGLASLICAKKGIRSFRTIILVMLSGVGAMFLGGLVGLIPVAYLTTFAANKPSNTETF